MKTKTIKLVIAILLIGKFLFGQGWEQTYNLHPTYQDIGFEILILDNGEYLISGNSMDGSDGDPSMFVSRISFAGNLVWSKHYSFYPPDSLNTLAAGIVKASDGGYILAGTESNFFNYALNKLIVIKIDEANGDTLWIKRHDFPDTLLLDHFKDITSTPDGGYVVVGHTVEPGRSVIVKIDALGELEWIKYIAVGAYATKALAVVLSSDDNIVVSGWFKETNTNSSQRAYIQKLNLDGNEIWMRDYDYEKGTSTGFPKDLEETIDNGFIFTSGDKIIKTDSEGNLEWENSNLPGEPTGVSQIADGGYIFTGNFNNGVFNRDLVLFKTNSSGEILWFRFFGWLIFDWGNDVIQTPDSSFIITGKKMLDLDESDGGELYVIKTNSSGYLFDNFVKGRVFKDEDFNCFDDSGEPGMSSNIVQVIGTDTLYTYADEEGFYELNLDTGNYAIRSILPNPYWGTCIGDPFPFEIINVPDTVTIDLPAQVIFECPYLEVDISTPLLRRCFENIYYVNYCNSGTAVAEDAIVTVILDPFLEYQSASIDLTSQSGDTLTFEVGGVDIYECGSFTITTYLDCDSTVLGQTHCVTALISPDSICLPVDPLWDGASLKVDAECTGDSIFFIIENIGENDMSSPRNYIVTEDVIMYDEGQVQLLSGESIQVFAEVTNGATWRLEVDQVEGHPGNSNPSIVVEGCVPFGTPFTQYFVNAFPQNDGDPFVSIDCQENIGAYDPNDKRGFPYGWDNEHFIERNEDLEYMIRFQNTGTDTAFTVKIKDQISPHLNISTIRPGASSHPYQLGFEGTDVLTFNFNNIMLPDSNINEVASHGFVKFKISQKEDLPLGTVIYNQANIFFDFNEAVVTNETFHTVAEPLITITVEPPFFKNVTINAYPNPFKESAIIQVKGADAKDLNLHLFDIHGRLMTSRKAENNQIILQRNGLTTGIYFYRIEGDGQLIGVGKLIVQ